MLSSLNAKQLVNAAVAGTPLHAQASNGGMVGRGVVGRGVVGRGVVREVTPVR